MAAHERGTEECEPLGRLYENHQCLYNTMNKYYKDKNNVSDNNCSGTQNIILFLVHFLLSCKQRYALKVG